MNISCLNAGLWVYPVLMQGYDYLLKWSVSWCIILIQTNKRTMVKLLLLFKLCTKRKLTANEIKKRDLRQTCENAWKLFFFQNTLNILNVFDSLWKLCSYFVLFYSCMLNIPTFELCIQWNCKSLSLLDHLTRHKYFNKITFFNCLFQI